MNQQLVFSALIELLLIGLTSFLLVQPGLFFSGRSTRTSSWATTGGLILLCATFMWSLIFGCMLMLNGITVRFPGL